jgi:two-component system response regulator YesN
MYKTVLVEDEIIIRENIRDNFPWQKHNLLYAGEASDGESALQLIGDVKPQIVITDIKMPFLGGLDLSRIIRQQMPWIKIIIMTGHDEFELAQQALKIGVSDYLLKPIGLSDLEKSIQAVVAVIEQEEQNFQNIEKLQEETEINRNYLKNDFLKNLLSGVLSLPTIYETASELGLNIQASWYAVVLLHLNIPEDSSGNSYDDLIKALSIIRFLEEDTILLVRESLKSYALIIKGSDEKTLQNSCYRIGESVKAEVEGKTVALVSVYIGGAVKRLIEVHQSYQDAMKIANFSYLFGSHKIVGIDDLVMVNPYHGFAIPFERNELARFLRVGTKQDLEDFLAIHRDRFLSYPQTLFHIMLIRFNLYYEIAQLLDEIGFTEELRKNVTVISSLMGNCSQQFHVEEMMEQAALAITYAIEQRELCIIQKYDHIIEKAKAYIRNNFSKNTLQLPDVAAYVNVSAGHLSTVFNQEMGMSYTDYVAEVRIEKAKELLMTTDMSSAEIAFQVGYNDPHYFYTIFKKVTGMTSSAFRNNKETE